MKCSRFVVAASILSISLAAFAQGAAAQSKSRQDVQQELLQAQHDGVIPVSKHSYPPSPELVQRNRELHQVTVHRGEKQPMLDAHDSRTTIR